jgi:SAM-dependent methyltransferase
VSFDVAADAYGRFMGRFSEPLAAQFTGFADVATADRVLDVGCGPGALTAQLVGHLGAEAVSAIDPSEPFVAAARDRLPGVDVRLGAAEQLPWPDATFDRALAQLVVQFMADPGAGVGEMRRVTRPGGLVAASVWDHGTGRGPLSPFWKAARATNPGARGESAQVGVHQGELAEVLRSAGLHDVEESLLTVTVGFESFEQWWEPYTFGVGPAGAYVARLDEQGRKDLADRCREVLPDPPFELAASAWCARGHA